MLKSTLILLLLLFCNASWSLPQFERKPVWLLHHRRKEEDNTNNNNNKAAVSVTDDDNFFLAKSSQRVFGSSEDEEINRSKRNNRLIRMRKLRRNRLENDEENDDKKLRKRFIRKRINPRRQLNSDFDNSSPYEVLSQFANPESNERKSRQLKRVSSERRKSDEDEDEIVPTLNVTEEDSPYALISKFFKNRERNHKKMNSDFEKRFFQGRLTPKQEKSIGELKPREVWLSEGNLLVLKGGMTNDKENEHWEPLDDYQAPYREPKLPPPDFVPDENGVGVPLPVEDEHVEEDDYEDENEYEDNNESEDEYNNDDDNSIASPPTLFQDFAFPDHFDEEQFISEMENFHAVRHALFNKQHSPSVVTVTPPPNFSTQSNYFVTTSSPDSFSYAYFTSTESPNKISSANPSGYSSSPRPISSTPRPNFSSIRPQTSSPRPNYSTPRPKFSTSRPSFSTSRPNFNTVLPESDSEYSVTTQATPSNPIPGVAAAPPEYFSTPRPALHLLSDPEPSLPDVLTKHPGSLGLTTPAPNQKRIKKKKKFSYLRDLKTKRLPNEKYHFLQYEEPVSQYDSNEIFSPRTPSTTPKYHNTNDAIISRTPVPQFKSRAPVTPINPVTPQFDPRTQISPQFKTNEIFIPRTSPVPKLFEINEVLLPRNDEFQTRIPKSHFFPRLFPHHPRRRRPLLVIPPDPSDIRSLPTPPAFNAFNSQFQSPSQVFNHVVIPEENQVRRRNGEKYVSYFHGGFNGKQSWGYSYRL